MIDIIEFFEKYFFENNTHQRKHLDSESFSLMHHYPKSTSFCHPSKGEEKAINRNDFSTE